MRYEIHNRQGENITNSSDGYHLTSDEAVADLADVVARFPHLLPKIVEVEETCEWVVKPESPVSSEEECGRPTVPGARLCEIHLGRARGVKEKDESDLRARNRDRGERDRAEDVGAG